MPFANDIASSVPRAITFFLKLGILAKLLLNWTKSLAFAFPTEMRPIIRSRS